VPSHLYSFSFALNPRWNRSFSSQPEIWAYLRDCACRFGIQPSLRLGHEVRRASWDDGEQRWRAETSGGAWTADVLIAATGPLSEPSVPALRPGRVLLVRVPLLSSRLPSTGSAARTPVNASPAPSRAPNA
jgi:cation diffusion facilitator CzcD-associated flavoprotein CzcO